MKLEHIALSHILLQAAVAVEPVPEKPFINWDILEHPIVESFNWHRPFPDDGTPPMGFETLCNVVSTMHAKQYKYREFNEHLKPYATVLHDFYQRRHYQGHWDGVNEGGDNRDIIMMDWKDVPKLVRAWIEEQQLSGKDQTHHWTWLVLPKAKNDHDVVTTTVGVGPVATGSPAEEPTGKREIVPKLKDKEKVLFFQAGSSYDILPLFVAHQGKCEKEMSDLSTYHTIAKDKGVVAWVIYHSKPDPQTHKMDWRIRAEVVDETEHGRHHRTMWERLMINARRSDRKYEKDRRRQEGDRMKDEL